jgi:hypothetical protein
MPADVLTAGQIETLERILLAGPTVAAVLERASALDLPDWYLGAGAIAQTVWNDRHGFEPGHGIRDYDLVYFDGRDLSETAEDAAAARARALFADLGITLDVTNEARVHEWYPARFGRRIEPYRSTEHAITTWPTTATSVGVRRANGRTQQVYEAKVDRWRSIWPKLTIVPW